MAADFWGSGRISTRFAGVLTLVPLLYPTACKKSRVFWRVYILLTISLREGVVRRDGGVLNGILSLLSLDKRRRKLYNVRKTGIGPRRDGTWRSGICGCYRGNFRQKRRRRGRLSIYRRCAVCRRERNTFSAICTENTMRFQAFCAVRPG